MESPSRFLRYPGSKRRMLPYLTEYLPLRKDLRGKFVEPFVGGGVVYFHLNPKRAILSDLNRELIDLYKGIRLDPHQVWRLYRRFPGTKRDYKRIRRIPVDELDVVQRSARSLYLNRTCFKGMWRHNTKGGFNIGYGGQSRRWAITQKDLVQISKLLRRATIKCCDFEEIIDLVQEEDFLFVDPPYRPGKKELIHDHYGPLQFSFQDHERLAKGLKRAHRRKVRWALTISNHRAILGMYARFKKHPIFRGAGQQIGVSSKKSGEILVTNY